MQCEEDQNLAFEITRIWLLVIPAVLGVELRMTGNTRPRSQPAFSRPPPTPGDNDPMTDTRRTRCKDIYGRVQLHSVFTHQYTANKNMICEKVVDISLAAT